MLLVKVTSCLLQVGAANWFEFFVNNAPSGAASSTNTFNLTNVTTDNIDVTVRSWTNSSSICYDEDTITIRLNSVSGVNQISNASTICAGDDPAAFISNSVFTADRAGEGATLSYQWQSRTSITSFTNITGATSVTYDPSSLSTTTFFRRLVYSTFYRSSMSIYSPISGIQCRNSNCHAKYFCFLSVNAFNQTICDGEDLIVDASASTVGPSSSYRFYVNNFPQTAVLSTATATLPASVLSDNATITVRVYYNSGGTGCYGEDSLVLRINELSGANTISGSQTVYW